MYCVFFISAFSSVFERFELYFEVVSFLVLWCVFKCDVFVMFCVWSDWCVFIDDFIICFCGLVFVVDD